MAMYGVTGSTGHVGPDVIDAMLKLGVAPGEIVAIARTPEKAAALAEAGVQVRYGDYSRPETLPEALDGVERLLLISSSDLGTARIAQHANVVDAAVAAGVGHLVYTSVLRADTCTLPVGPDHRATEQAILQSGLPFTFLRNGYYTEIWAEQIPSYLTQGEIVGASDGALISGAARADFAAACAAVLTGDGHRNAVYELGGTPFTMDDVAQAVSTSTGTEVKYRNVSSEELTAILAATGMNEFFVSFLVKVEEGTADGEAYTDSTDLARLIGRPSTPLAEVIAAAVPKA